MNRTIRFVTGSGHNYLYVVGYYLDTLNYINSKVEAFCTSQLSFLSFDLLDNGFDKILLDHKGNIYELKLGKNTWTGKELRKEHNLLKLVTSYILNNEQTN